jgi:hypothetical protein
MVYNHHRAFLSERNPMRGTVLYDLQYHFVEEKTFPNMKSYSDYLYHGRIAPQTKEGVSNGVHGIWDFDQLDYAEHIWICKDPMHTFCNVIMDWIKVLRPSVGEFENRTEKKSVREACKTNKIFSDLFELDQKKQFKKAPWTLSKNEIDKVNENLARVKAPTRIRSPMINNGGANSHDRLIFATQYARAAFKDVNNNVPHIMANMLELFDIIAHLCLYRFHVKDDVDDIFIKLIINLCRREGLLPPCESTYVIHELVHIVDQIHQLGPPMMSSMWKYEQKNKWLKGLIKNKSSYLASVTKNYILSESISFLVGLDVDNWKTMKELFVVADPSIVDNISGAIKAIEKLKFDSETQIISCDPQDVINDELKYDGNPTDDSIMDFLLGEEE